MMGLINVQYSRVLTRVDIVVVKKWRILQVLMTMMTMMTMTMTMMTTQVARHLAMMMTMTMVVHQKSWSASLLVRILCVTSSKTLLCVVKPENGVPARNLEWGRGEWYVSVHVVTIQMTTMMTIQMVTIQTMIILVTKMKNYAIRVLMVSG